MCLSECQIYVKQGYEASIKEGNEKLWKDKIGQFDSRQKSKESVCSLANTFNFFVAFRQMQDYLFALDSLS